MCRLPFGERGLGFTPALSSSPGHAPTHEESFLTEAKVTALAPTSAMISWGARKIRECLVRRFSDIKIPAKSTIHAVLDRHGLVEHRGRLRPRAQGTALSLGQLPNELWCRQYCYPLTVTGHASRSG